MKLRTLIAAATVTLAAAPAAHAAPWQPVTDPGGDGIDQVGLLRTADGTLHVAWHRDASPITADLLHTAITPGGTAGPASPIVLGWSGVGDAALVAAPGGIRAFWGGHRSLDSADPNDEINTALSGDGGATWALTEGRINPKGTLSYASDVSATTLASGEPLQAWSGTLGVFAHPGLSELSPNATLSVEQYGYNPGITATGAGATVAWFSSATGHLGVIAQPVGPDGRPAGPPQTMPGTEDMRSGTVTRTPIATRAGTGEAWVAYTVDGEDVRVWRVGAPATSRMARVQRSAESTIAADANGKLWAVWTDSGFQPRRVYARRSNARATRWGAVVSVPVVRDTNTVASLDASATAGALDVLAFMATGTAPTGRTYHRRLRPGLTLTASRSSLPRRPRRVRFTVTDAGDPIAGATVRAGGKVATTNRRGRAALTLRGSARVRASADGYVGASVRLR